MGRVDWQTATSLGACGGAIFSLLPLWADLVEAHSERRNALRVGKPKPPFRDSFDLLGDLLVVIARTALGAISGAVFHTQLTDSATAGALAVGASAPLLLRQIGGIRAVSELLSGQTMTSDEQYPNLAASSQAAEEET